VAGRAGLIVALVIALATGALGAWCSTSWSRDFDARERALIATLAIDGLQEVPAHTTNPIALDDRAARFGQRLFFDPRTSANGAVSCATCHRPEFAFTDGLPVAVGAAVGTRNTIGLIGAAWSPWLFWDGRKDSLWSQALAPLENAVEHATTRSALARLVARDPAYRTSYEQVFATLPVLEDPDRFPPAATPSGDASARAAWAGMSGEDQSAVDEVFVNIGRALAAYQSRLRPGVSRFDVFAAALAGRDPDALGLLDQTERAGLRLFIGEAQCINCHNGPLFTNNEFHNTGVLPAHDAMPAFGRAGALTMLQLDAFSCAGDHSGAERCPELEFMRTGDELVGAHRTPGLRNVALTAPYMHAGQIATLEEVLLHYDLARDALVGHNEAKPLALGGARRRQIEAFLHTLTAPPAVGEDWLRPPG
jgi:cytochrome c peroxidase